MQQSSVEHEARYRAVVESQVEMVCRFRRDGTILFVNSAYAQARGTSAEELSGANFWEFIPPDEHAAIATLLDGLSREQPEVRIENRFTTTDGPRWTLWTNRVVDFDAAGHPSEFQSSGLDITDRKRAEEGLRASEQRYRHIFETAGVSIWDEDFSAVSAAVEELRASGIKDFAAYFARHPEWVDRAISKVKIRAVNPATLEMFAARDQAELLGSLNAIFLPHTREVFVAELVAIASGQRRFEAETSLRRLDGGTRDVLFTITFPERGESFASVLVTLTDITERKRMEADLRETARALQQSNRMKDEFLATLSHELRTPLNAVLGWAHMLRAGSLPADVADRAFESLERNARAQAQLIDDLLDMSRIVSGRLQISPEQLELAAVMHSAVETVRPAAASKGVELHVSVHTSERVVVSGDAERLRQIMWNLLSNAIKFTPAGGHVQFELRSDERAAEIVVRDSGEGIDPDFLPYVFERFRQADATSTRRHGGLGLGLSIARHLAEAHGGSITAESDGRNRGATFTVRLPREAAATPTPGQVTPQTPTLAGTSILVADDDADARELFRVALELAGATVSVAASAAEALALLANQRFDLLVADLGMPDCDAVALMRSVRKLADSGRQLPAIAITAYATARERAAILEAGFDAHVAKPVEPERLLSAVLDTLRKSS